MTGRMPRNKQFNVVFLILFALYFPAYVMQGTRTEVPPPYQQGVPPFSHLQRMERNSRRLMIGSTAPTCTYNECRGCKYKCRAEQVPVEGNDPINSAYHYRCVCHR